MKSITISAPGKLHLLGEHVVVYGKPALLTATNKRCEACITSTKEKTIDVLFTNLDKHMVITPDIVLERTHQARKTWETFTTTGDMLPLKELIYDPLQFLIFAIGETSLYLQKKLSPGFELALTSDIPIGSGMGSSAAIAVTVAGAVMRFLGLPLDKKAINTIAFNCEKLIHGNPSGGDNAACTYGGFIWYRKETPELKIVEPLQFHLSKNLLNNFVSIFTGKPDETTGEMVTQVKRYKSKVKSTFEKIMNNQEELTRDLVSALEKENIEQIKNSIQQGEANLEALGVVSESTKKVIRAIEAIGGVAKICGAGGKKHASGIVLAFHEDRKVLEDLLESRNLSYTQIVLGEEGVREE